MLDYAHALRAGGIPVPEIASKLIIPTGKNKGKNSSIATAYRVLAEEASEG